MPRAKIKCVLTCLVIIIHARVNRGATEKKECNLFRVPYRAKGTISIILDYALDKAGSLTVKTLQGFF